jgi:hypothetical protein
MQNGSKNCLQALPCFALQQKSSWHIQHEFARKIIVVLHERLVYWPCLPKTKILCLDSLQSIVA